MYCEKCIQMQQNCLKKGKKEVMDTGIGMIITSDTGDKSTGGMGTTLNIRKTTELHTELCGM